MTGKEYTDIHSHILMGVDDGAIDLDEAVKMLKLAYQEGISRILLTPHYKDICHSADPKRIQQKYRILQAEVERKQIPITLYLGNELYYSSQLVSCLEEKNVLLLADSEKYILVEFNPMEELVAVRNGLNELICNGYLPILAHAERYECLYKKDDIVRMLRDSGVLIQVNESGIMGRSGLQYKKRTRKLLKERLVDFVATDAHDSKKRAPYLSACGKYICKKYGEAYYNQIFYQNPTALLNHREI